MASMVWEMKARTGDEGKDRGKDRQRWQLQRQGWQGQRQEQKGQKEGSNEAMTEDSNYSVSKSSLDK